MAKDAGLPRAPPSSACLPADSQTWAPAWTKGNWSTLSTPHTFCQPRASAPATSLILPAVPPGSLHLLGLRWHKYSLLLLAWEDVQALTQHPGKGPKTALLSSAKHEAGIFRHCLLHPLHKACKARSSGTSTGQARTRLREATPLSEVTWLGGGRKGIQTHASRLWSPHTSIGLKNTSLREGV